MAEAIRGINRILLMRPYSERETMAAGRMAFQTSHEKSSSRDANSTITKDGNINSLSEVVVEYSLTTIMAKDDVVREALEKAYLHGELVEFWDIDRTAAGDDGKFPATYYQGYLTEWGESAGAEDSVEISLSAAINGAGIRGCATLSNDQANVVQYTFSDTIVAN